MKPLFSLTLYSRDPMDPQKVTPFKVIEFDYPGKASLILDRNTMGEIVSIDEPTFSADENFAGMVDEFGKTLTELKIAIQDCELASRHCQTDLFQLKRWLNG